MVLRSPRENSGNEGDAHASSLIPEQIGDTGGFVVSVLRQIRVCKLADGHKERSNPEPLDCPIQSHVFVIRSEINPGVSPHGDRNTAIDSDDGNPRLREKARGALASWLDRLESIIEEGQRQ